MTISDDTQGVRGGPGHTNEHGNISCPSTLHPTSTRHVRRANGKLKNLGEKSFPCCSLRFETAVYDFTAQ